MYSTTTSGPVNILLVEDSAGDVELARVAISGFKIANRLFVVSDGVEALDFLHRRGLHQDVPRPGLILLDLNLPKLNGREVLAEIKEDEDLKSIPVVVLSSSRDEQDIVQAYRLHANCFITKPIDLGQFLRIIRTIEDFWLTIVRLPSPEAR